jgi:hypothetical protein
MFLDLIPIGRFLILLVGIHVHEAVISGGNPFFCWIPHPGASNSRWNSFPLVNFHVKDLVIPGGIPLPRWIPHLGACNSHQNNLSLLYTVQVYSFCEVEIWVFLIDSTFFMLHQWCVENSSLFYACQHIPYANFCNVHYFKLFCFACQHNHYAKLQ